MKEKNDTKGNQLIKQREENPGKQRKIKEKWRKRKMKRKKMTERKLREKTEEEENEGKKWVRWK